MTCLALLGLLATTPATEAAVEGEAERDASPWYWDEGKTRAFVAARAGLGASAYGELDVGYGKPFWLWAGLQAWGLSTTESAMGSLGFKLALPIFELSGGYRLTSAFARSALPAQSRYDSGDLDAHDDASSYASLDLDAFGYVPLPHFVLTPELGFHRIVGASAAAIYEEQQRVITRPRWLLYAKLGVLFTWGEGRRYAVGPLIEHFGVGRGRAITRLGPCVAVRFTHHLDALLVATLPLRGPDSLGFYDSLGGTLSLRYRGASGEHAPAFP